MAIKKKDDNLHKPSRLVEVLTTEYKWENLLLGALTIIALSLSVLIISGILTIDPSFPILGSSPNDLIFAWIILVLSVLGAVLLLYPFLVPSFPEIRKITWPTWKIFLDASIRTIVFTAILTLFIFYYDVLVKLIMDALNGIFESWVS